MPHPSKILLVEDDESFGYILKEYLGLHGLNTVWIKNGDTAIQKIKEDDFDLCILDIMLPGANGLEIAKSLKAISPSVPFIFLTAKSLKTDKLKGFQAGCDDYEVKPVDEELLLAKIRAILNRVSTNKSPLAVEEVYTLGEYVFNSSNQTLSYGDEIKVLSPKETALLKLLLDYKNRLVERKYILKQIWGVADLFSRKTMDVFVTRIRKYLSRDSSLKIMNIHNKGFILYVPDK